MNEDEYKARLRQDLRSAIAALAVKGTTESSPFNRHAFALGWMIGAAGFTGDEYEAVAKELRNAS
jgi:hypothetical protein